MEAARLESIEPQMIPIRKEISTLAYKTVLWKIIARFLVSSLLFFFLLCTKKEETPDFSSGEPIVPMKEYTQEYAREWTDISDEHALTARKSMNDGKPAILIETKKLTPTFSHYIEKFGIMDMQGKELASVSIPKGNSPPNYGYVESSVLPLTGKIKIFAKCNMHDLWVATIDLKNL